ncbi:MAG: gamma-glutamyltransferase, partial [Burkholderiaceae bacterium]
MVASADVNASLAGCRVLARGGSAADAAVAVQAVLGVSEPFASGLGGGSVVTYYDAASNKFRTYDGLSAAPSTVGASGTSAITSIYQAAVADDRQCKAGLALGASISAQQGHTNISGRAAGVPGTVKVLDLVHQAHGRAAWNTLWDEAIDMAANGFPMHKYMYSSLYSEGTVFDDEPGDPLNAGGVPACFNSDRDRWGPARCEYKDIQARYCDPSDPTKRKPLPVGTTLYNAELAATMRLVRDGGAAAFYNPAGPIVQSILQRFRDDKYLPGTVTHNCESILPAGTRYDTSVPGTGTLTIIPARIPSLMVAADFADYRAIERKPLSGVRFGHTIYTQPAPLFGGVVELYALGLLERKNLTSHAFGSPTFAYLVTEASRLANADRRAVVGDPAYTNVNTRVEALLSAGYLDGRAALMTGTALGSVASGTPLLPAFATADPAAFDPRAKLSLPQRKAGPERALSPRTLLARHGAPARHGEDWNTTSSIAIIDGFGNAMAMTTTINTHWGAQIEAGGMLLNTAMSNFSASAGSNVNGYAANRRPRSSIAPSIAFDTEGRVRLVWGAAGGGPIPDYIVKAFLGNVVYGMDMQAALNAPNWTGQNGMAELESGTAFGAQAAGIRSSFGHSTSTLVVTGLKSGLAGIAVTYDANGFPVYSGAADARRNGGAAGY